MPFLFNLNQVVEFIHSDERGRVEGRAEYMNSENQYYLRYKNGLDCYTEGWFGQSVLMSIEDDEDDEDDEDEDRESEEFFDKLADQES
jgi:hypothetical protein